LKNPRSAPDMHDKNLNYKFNLTSKIGSSVVVDLKGKYMFSVAQFFFLQRGKQNMYTLQERL
jgi:hypothetical protein